MSHKSIHHYLPRKKHRMIRAYAECSFGFSRYSDAQAGPRLAGRLLRSVPRQPNSERRLSLLLNIDQSSPWLQGDSPCRLTTELSGPPGRRQICACKFDDCLGGRLQ